MDRLTRIANLWNWLPGFRVVAETENLHEAARRMFISPSALSRTIKLLEEQLGEQLFERAGRQLQLTRLGDELLTVVRDAMRSIDDVLTARPEATRSLRIAISSALTQPVLLPALAAVQRDHGVTSLMIAGDPDRSPISRLLCGELDMVLTCEPIHDERVIVTVVHELPFSVYVHADHPLSNACEPCVDALRLHPFVTYPIPPNQPADHWPSTLPRTVGMHVHDARLALGACAAGAWLAVLPDAMVTHTREGQQSGLQRLALDVIPAAPLSAVYRQASSTRDLSAKLIDALRECAVGMPRTGCADR
ncbi:MAG: LysR family transcriptional regulator [Myxococcota bacterium]|nr:LysR family transcriptional regulator [Myxococcota bacterium]